jgi:crotonobetainyl-CoA:carnitine CoA-transferase CaiB-like acyl-CoA transferase
VCLGIAAPRHRASHAPAGPAVLDSAPSDGGALADLVVIDLSRVLAGPYAAQMLGDHGADVVKVEPPAGDTTRLWGPGDEEGISPYYAGLNRNKRHLGLDLSSDGGRAVLLALLADADVLIENFLAGTMAKWGLAPEWLLDRFPALVYCRISAFGTSGSMAGLPGYDAVLQAYSGLMHLNGERDGGPIRTPMPIADLTAGLHAFGGILAALHERNRSGRGQLVDISLLDSALSLQHPAAANYFATGRPPRRLGSGHPNIAPCNVFEASDGYVYVAAGTDRQFRTLCDYLGVPELADDPRFVANTDRIANEPALRAALASALDELTVTADTAREMISLGIPASIVRRLEDVLGDPQVVDRDMVPTVGRFRVIGVPVKLSRTPGSVRTPPRAPGADGVTVARQLGLSPEVIDILVRSGALTGTPRSTAASESAGAGADPSHTR